MSSVTPFEHTLIGAIGGSVEVVLMQPMVGIKNALQEGRPVPMNPLHLYRGLAMNCVSMAPITASQFGTNRIFSQLILCKEEKDLGPLERLSSAAVSGAASAFIASPSELVIIHQQKTGKALVTQAKDILTKYGASAYCRGIVPAIGRETLYAAGYLGVMPILKNYLDNNHSDTLSPTVRLFISGITGGVLGAFFSHPFDTAKTKMQASMYGNPDHSTLRSTFASVIKAGSIMDLWNGIAPRMFRIVCAAFILNYVKTTSVDYLEDSRKK